MIAPFTALILAAGMGKRMNSDLPKVLHPALEKPLIVHVLGQLQPLHPARTVVVVGHKEELVKQALEERLLEAIESCTRADVPLGVFLSGGIDSALVLAACWRRGLELPAFTLAFDEPAYDESARARTIARLLGAQLTVPKLDSQGALDLLERMADHLDFPLADASVCPANLISPGTRASARSTAWPAARSSAISASSFTIRSVEVIPDASHMAFVEQPKAYLASARAFFDQLS